GPHGSVELLDGPTRRLITRVEASASLVKAAAADPGGRTIAFPVAGEGIRFFDRTGKALPTLGVTGEVRALSYSPDGRFLAVGREDGSVRLVGMRNLQEVGVLHGHTSAVVRLAFSPDGRLLAALA